MRRVLGAILAGGQARRFGSDKAMAMLDGATLIARVEAWLRSGTDDIVVVGRDGGIVDRPAGIGPLGGLAAAIAEGAVRGYDTVLSAPCDTPVLTDDALRALLAETGPAYLAACPVIGVWPCSLAPQIDAHIAETEDRSLRAWTRACDAKALLPELAVPNVNTLDDLAELKF